MKFRKLTAVILSVVFFWNCTDDVHVFPPSDNPVIEVERDVLYSNPGRKFQIRAHLSDDLGLESVQILSPELYLDKLIAFNVSDMLKEYDLNYTFLAPKEVSTKDVFNITIILKDVSKNTVSHSFKLRLDGDFNAPMISGLKPTDGTILLMMEENEINMTWSFDLTDESGLNSLEVIQDKLNIHDRIELGGARNYHYERNVSLPNEVAAYEIKICATDTFVETNTLSMKVRFSIAEGFDNMYLADVPIGTDLTSNDIVGVPMYFHALENGVFVFHYYADRDNKEVYFLGQESSFNPHCFGAAGDGELVNSLEAAPVVLPEKGYYEIRINPAALTYEAVSYTPSSPVYISDDETPFIVVANGMTAATADITWACDVSNKGARLTNDPENPYVLTKEVELTGSTVQCVVSAAGWAPFWRLDANGCAIFNGGTEHPYNGSEGRYILRLDTELSRLSIIRKK